MDIHKPKPWHGLREFLKEYVIIVVGVLTALGAEQVVEAMHWAHQVDTAEVALKAAFVREAGNAAERAAQDACITQRLAVLSGVVRQATESGRLPQVGAIGHPPYSPWTVAAWDALVASQTVVHLPREKMIAYTRVATTTAYLSGLSDREEARWTILDSMNGPGRRLSDAEAEQLRITLAEAAAANRNMRRVSANLRQALKATGLVGATDLADADKAAAAGKRQAAICAPMDAEGA
jgi:hypothetical protein